MAVFLNIIGLNLAQTLAILPSTISPTISPLGIILASAVWTSNVVINQKQGLIQIGSGSAF